MDTCPPLPNHLLDLVITRLQSLTGEEFQDLLIEHLKFRSREFISVDPGPIKGSDGGVDIEVAHMSPTGATERTVFSCKRWSQRIGAAEIDGLASAAVRRRAQQAVLVSTLGLTGPAQDRVKELEGNSTILYPFAPWTGRGLAETLVRKSSHLLLHRFRDLATSLAPTAYTSNISSFEVVDLSTCIAATSADWFFNGFAPDWADLTAQFDLPRFIYSAPNGIQETIRSRLKGDRTLSIVSVVGVSGSGKTTLLRRAAFDMRSEGIQVLRLKDNWKQSGNSPYSQIQFFIQHNPAPTLVLIDDAAAFFSLSPLTFDGIDTIVSSCGAPVVLLVAEEPHHWSRIERTSFGKHPNCAISCICVSHLNDAECKGLVDKIISLETTGQLTPKGGASLDREVRLRLCVTRAERQLLVAMLQIRHGEGFREIIHKEFDRLGHDSSIQEAYALTCYFQSLNVLLPQRVLWKMLGLSASIEISRFQRETAELIIRKADGFVARHQRIAWEIVNYAYTSAEARHRALKSMLMTLDLNEQEEQGVFVDLMSAPGRYRRILNDCDYSKTLIDDLYGGIIAGRPRLIRYLSKFVYSAHGMALRVLGDISRAREAFRNSLACDPRYIFALRQLAWLEHSQGNLADAGRLAEEAAKCDPDDPQTQLQCARILELNTFENFKRAGHYYERAQALAPHDEKAAEAKEKYDAIVQHVVPALRDLKNDHLLPDYVIKDLRPSLASLKGMLGPNHKSVKMKLWGDLFYMQEDVSEDERNVHELIAGVDYKSDKRIRALVASNIARSKYLDWYHNGTHHNPEEIETLFKESMNLDPQNPFSYCWYGTFRKEMRKDSIDADKYYRIALRKADDHTNKRLSRHPLILNNIALLIIDDVLQGKKKPEALSEALKLAKEAVIRVEALKSKFFWPEHTLANCEAMVHQEMR